MCLRWREAAPFNFKIKVPYDCKINYKNIISDWDLVLDSFKLLSGLQETRSELNGEKNTISFGIVTSGEILEKIDGCKMPPIYVINEDVDDVICGVAIVGLGFNFGSMLNIVDDLYLIDPEDNKLYLLSARKDKHQTTKSFVDTGLTVSLEYDPANNAFFAKDSGSILDDFLSNFKIQDTQ